MNRPLSETWPSSSPPSSGCALVHRLGVWGGWLMCTMTLPAGTTGHRPAAGEQLRGAAACVGERGPSPRGSSFAQLKQVGASSALAASSVPCAWADHWGWTVQRMPALLTGRFGARRQPKHPSTCAVNLSAGTCLTGNPASATGAYDPTWPSLQPSPSGHAQSLQTP